ncbi:MarR family winged helix-turn-helix transcriptional regulator [Sphingobacterium hungaricum]|uniref:MarR family transcriptional regulator n=1 Tax=Sphingobacterium hungaricum TaxID=2082723 RepID=A0A928UTY5_9SPHI|nr:MarR family transcriptional regulator [Sphingobacterium hungaricum]MBE8713170.1 MarR family transcriptional regulator [Sphingobacterium hungaricum]
MSQLKTLDYYIKTAWQTVANKYNVIASQYGFTQAAGYILINIHKDGTSVSEIANSTGVKTTSLSRVLNNLESLGFIYRETNANDKRSVKVYLTELGKEKRKLAKDVVLEFNTVLENELSEKERNQLIKTLTKINDLAAKYQPHIISTEEQI